MAQLWERTLTTLCLRQFEPIYQEPAAGCWNRPRFKPHLRVEVIAGEGVFVISGSSQTLLRGQVYERVAPYVGGGRSADEACGETAPQGQVSPAEVYFAITQLEKKGYLCEQEQIVPDHLAAWWWSQAVDPRVRLFRRRVQSKCRPMASRKAHSCALLEDDGIVWWTSVGRRRVRRGGSRYS